MSRGSYPVDEPARGDSVPPAQLVRLHRHSLTHVVVVGGTAERRAQVARAFHRESPLRGAQFVAVDAADDARLRTSLLIWSGQAEHRDDHPLRSVEHGTLFIDHAEQLSAEAQRLLLALAQRLLGEPGPAVDVPSPGRIVIGNPHPLAPAIAEGRFSRPLYDSLDKVRVELEVPPGEGDR